MNNKMIAVLFGGVVLTGTCSAMDSWNGGKEDFFGDFSESTAPAPSRLNLFPEVDPAGTVWPMIWCDKDQNIPGASQQYLNEEGFWNLLLYTPVDAFTKEVFEKLEWYLQHGVCVNNGDFIGITPLEWARRKGNKELIQFFLAHGAKTQKGILSTPTAKEKSGMHVSFADKN